ncbi:hypothetical protein DS2_10572 [Catenovulum agarivorans DS-2]|uniref:Uncharacterized protein n=1 Tax=Catenovulum agarivorans DS-2 TaxID=1328313 RepID=W7QAN4_9ALTE|nr:hypothetical protein [Catenovulum agarivorans]EWH09884.1 hypothetical protein DS2_10572 [Catenovulum agarivorans DS-2]
MQDQAVSDMLNSSRTYKLIRIVTWSVGITSLAIFYVWFEYLRPSTVADLNQGMVESSFNPFVWAKGRADYSTTNPRQALYIDVLRNHIATGLSVEQVEAKLGLPDSTSQPRQHNYLLSFDINTGIYQYLVIQFDANQKVVLYYRYEVNHAIK